MRNSTTLKLIFIFCFIGCFTGLSAQAGIGVFSRHLGLPGGEVAVGRSDRDTSLDFLGVGVELRLDRETHKLYSFIIGVSLQKKNNPNYSAPAGIFLQANWKLFKPIIKKDKLSGFFSIGPRLFALNQSFMPLSGINQFPTNSSRIGFESQFAFNLDYKINDDFTLISFVNVISLAYSIATSTIDNPVLTPSQRTFRGIDIDGRIFNELRIGLMYNFGK